MNSSLLVFCVALATTAIAIGCGNGSGSAAGSDAAAMDSPSGGSTGGSGSSSGAGSTGSSGSSGNGASSDSGSSSGSDAGGSSSGNAGSEGGDAPPDVTPDATVWACTGGGSGYCWSGIDNAAAPIIKQTSASGALPTFAGGTLSEGTYHLTSDQVYSDAGPAVVGSIAEVLVVSAADGASGTGINGVYAYAPNECYQIVLTVSATSSELTVTEPCGLLENPDGGFVPFPGTASYTATPTTLTLAIPQGTFTPGSGGTEVQTFTKQ